MNNQTEGVNHQPDDNKEWGDIYNKNEINSVNIISVNIQGFPHTEHSKKNQTIKNFIEDYKVDIMAMQELNTCWKQLPIKQRINNRIKHWFEAQSMKASYFNK